MMQTLKNVDKAIAASGVEGTFSVDTQAYGRIRKFCIAVQLARCGDAAARRIKDLFAETDKAVMLSRIYRDIGESEYERGGLARDMLNRMEDLGHVFSEGIAHLYALLQERTGVPENERQGLRQAEELNEALVGKNAVKDDLLALAGENADRDKAGFLNVIVSGRGQGADKVRGLYSNVLGERPFKPDVKIRKNVNDNVLGMFNRNFCKTRKVGNIELLKADLESGRIDVVLPGNVRLTRDDAFGRLASFLTHGEAQSYDDRDIVDGINDNIGNNPHGHTHLRHRLGDLAFNGEVDDYNEDEVQVQAGGVVCTTSFKLTVN